MRRAKFIFILSTFLISTITIIGSVVLLYGIYKTNHDINKITFGDSKIGFFDYGEIGTMFISSLTMLIGIIIFTKYNNKVVLMFGFVILSVIGWLLISYILENHSTYSLKFRNLNKINNDQYKNIISFEVKANFFGMLVYFTNIAFYISIVISLPVLIFSKKIMLWGK